VAARRKPRGKPRARGPAAPAHIEPGDVLGALRGRRRPLRSPAAIARSLGLGREAARPLRQVLRALERDGAVERFEGRYRLPRRDGRVEGTYSPLARGGGLVVGDDGERWKTVGPGPAAPGDRVLLEPVAPGRGEVLGVLEGRRDLWVGVLSRHGGPLRLTPHGAEPGAALRVSARDAGGGRDGDVVAALPLRARGDRVPRARVVEVLGRPGDPEASFRAVSWLHRLPVPFPAAVLREARALPEAPAPEEVSRRVDLRALPFCTIDPADARDHDDAICVDEQRGRGSTRLRVAVADVSHYVPPDAEIDREALCRGNSVYFPDRSVPMLPERLSSDLCSLVPDHDRLVLVADLDVDAAGEARPRGFYPAVIRSHGRLVYEHASRVMEGGTSAEVPAALVGPLRRLADVTRALGRRRLESGSIDLDLPSRRVLLGPGGHPRDVVAETRTLAHRAVEEAMLAANRAVAEALHAAGVPALYRNHEPPAPEDIAELRDLLARFDLLRSKRDRGPRPFDLAEVLERVAGHEAERIVNQAVLRSMRQARYEASSRGHFALGFEHYTHFTSPIRRYADLAVHRALRLLLGEAGGHALDGERALAVAGRLSWLERRAETAEREAVDLAACAVLAPRVGESFEARITGVARYGLYVSFEAPFADGLVHVSRFPEVVAHDPAAHALVGRRSGKRYRLGDPLTVRLEAVDLVRGRIDCALPGSPGAGAGRRGQRPRSRRSRSDSSL
jgi:ribonuclease R